MVAFQFCLQSEKQRKLELVGDDSKKFPDEKGNVRWCIVVMQQPKFEQSP
jgi:hypothetical protein